MDRSSRLMNAPLSRVFESLVDREALETWLPPDGMTGRFERFDPRPGGSYPPRPDLRRSVDIAR